MPLPLVFHPDYDAPLPPGHRFPMAKFVLLQRYLLEMGHAQPQQFHQPQPPTDALLQRAHDPHYIRAFTEGKLDAMAIRRIGLPWSQVLVRRTRIAVTGTLRTAELAIEHGLACNTAGGTHHAHRDFGSGFCIFNDLAVTAAEMLARHPYWKILIIDLDVHQGDGTAAIFQDEPRVFTFSMHCANNFPLRKATSDLDVALPVGMCDDSYLETLSEHLEPLLSRVQPNLVLYDAGVDPHMADRLGRLKLTDAGLAQRDRMVIEACVQRTIPTACVIGGGYDADHHRLAERHSILHRTASDIYDKCLK